ncbi:MAG: Fibronectin type domain protein [Marmoricola sp.]|nr:Fibronectin type domain protein [Marmoricola sp.]
MRFSVSVRRLVALAAVSTLSLSGLAFNAATALSPGVSFSSGASSTWQTDGIVWAVGQSQGKVIAGGTFTQLRPPEGGTATPVAVNGLAILDAESGAPDSCQLSLGSATSTVRAITTSEDGKTVYIGGEFGSVAGVGVSRVAAIDVATCKVTAFRTPQFSSTVRALAVKGTTLYVGGDFKTVGTSQRLRFAAVSTATGALLPWVADADNVGKAIAVSPDGTKVAIGGNFANVNGTYSHSIAVVDGVSGANLRTYPTGFIPATSTTQAIISGTDGRFYVGNEGTGGGVFDGRFAVSWDTLDQVWRDTCLGATQALALYKGTLYSGSHAHDCSSIDGFQDGKRNYLNAETADGGKLLGWGPQANDGIGEGIGPRALVVATGRTTGKDYLWVGGEFTKINGVLQQGLTRFGTDDTVTPPVVAPAAEATSDGTIQVKWRTVVDSDDSEITYSVFRSGTVAPVWTGVASSVWWRRPQVTFVDTNVTPGTTYSYRVQASDGTNTNAKSALASATATAAAPSYASTVRSDHPILDWSSRTSGTWVQDSGAASSDTRRLSGQAAQGVASSTDSPVADGSGSLSFDGADDYVWSDEYAMGPTTYSVETWIKTNTNRGGKIIGYGNGRPNSANGNTALSGSYDRQLYMENTGFVRFGAYNGSTTTLRTPSALNDNQWHHLVGTQGAGGMSLYVDGRLVGANAVSGSQAFRGVWHVGGDQIGSWPNRPSSNFFAGLIDETAVYSSVLSARTVAGHYQAAGRTLAVNPRPTDSYGAAVYNADPSLYWRLNETSGAAGDSSFFGSNPGTYGSAVQRGVSGAVTGNLAARTSGTSQGGIATQRTVTATSTFSAEVWFNTTTTTGGKILGFENTATGNGGTYDKQLYMSNDGRLTFGTYNGAISAIKSPKSYNDGKWHHAVATLGSDGTKVYLDGSLIGSNSTTTAATSDGYWRLGGGNLNGWPDAPSSSYFNGAVDELAIYPTVLSSDTVAQHYGIGVADVEAPTKPAGLSGGATGSTITLSWTASTDNVAVTGYRVYRGSSATFTPSDANLVSTVTGTTFTQTAPAGTYYYRVVAVDGTGNASDASDAYAVTVADTTPPTQPANVTATPSNGAVNVAWSASTDNVGVTGYTVYRGTTADFTPAPPSSIGTSSTNSFSDPNVAMGTYYYKVVARDAAGNASDPSTSATAVVGDSQAPTTPATVTAAVTNQSVKVDWSAATDNVAVTGYRVYRGTTSGFVASDATKVGEVAGNTVTYTNTNLAAGTYYYKVIAVDGAGNTSAASAPATATVAAPPAPAQPVTFTLNATEDAMTAQAAPGTNYATTNQLSAKGGTTGASESFLKFALPAAPAGTTLTSATLMVRTSDDTTAASTDTTELRVLDNATWSETTLNWTNRPTGTGTLLAQLGGTTALNTVYSTGADTSVLTSRLASTITLRLSDGGVDNLRLWSTNNTSATSKPRLVLTFTPNP